MTNLVPIKDRLKELLKMKNINARHLGELAHISEASMSQYINGKVKPKQDRIYAIAQVMNVNPAWLLGYDVSPHTTHFQHDENNCCDLYNICHNTEIHEIAEILSALDEVERGTLASIIRKYKK